MKCNTVRRLLSPYTDGELAGQAQGAITQHLASCPACRKEAGEMQAAKAALLRATAPEVSPFLVTRVMAEVRALESRPAPRPAFALRRALAAAATVLVVALGVGAGAVLGTSIAQAGRSSTVDAEELGVSQTSSTTVDVFEPVLGAR